MTYRQQSAPDAPPEFHLKSAGCAVQCKACRRLYATKAGLPETAMVIDATAPLECVVDDILARIG